MNFHVENILRYISFIFKIILVHIFILLKLPAFAQDKIGSITAIEGSAISINTNDEERELSIFDSIYTNDEIFVSEGSTLTIQYQDNTTIILKEFTNLNVYEFEKSELSQKFNAKLDKGEIVIESGSIAKNSRGEMLIDLSKLQLGVRGTRINLNINESGESKVVLAEDSFGNVGEVSLNIGGQTTNLENSDEVVELNQENEFLRRKQTPKEAEELSEVNDSLVEVSKINESELDQQLNQKLQEGKLEDANNDGVINDTDIEVAKETITSEKKANLDFIVENSKTDNTEFLSDVLDQSDEKNIGETITKIIEVKDDLIEDVVDNLSDKDNTFIISSTSDQVVAVKEKIFETIVSKETIKSAEVLSKVMSKSDEGTVDAVINNITEKNTNKDSTLSLKVMADFSEKSPEKLEQLSETNADQVEKLTIDAVQKATTSSEDVDLIAKVVAVTNDKIVNIVVEEVSKTSTEEKQNLSAKVLKAIVDTQPNKIEIINNDIKDIMIKQTVESAKNQKEGTGIQDEQDLTAIVSDIIVNTDTQTASKIINEVNNTQTETNLSLEIISGISQKDTTKLNILSENNKEQIETLTEKAVENAENTAEDSQLIANIVSVVSDDLANKVVEEVSKVAIDEKQSFSVKVLKAIVDTEPEKIEIINEEIKENLIEQAIEATIDQQEGNLIEEENLTDAVSEIIVKTDTNTAAKVIEQINDITTETNLSLEVISAMSEKDSEIIDTLSEFNKEEMNKLTIDAVQNAENTSKDSDLIAQVVSVVNDDLVNIMVEEVSKVSVDEKQTLSAKVLQAIVDTEPDKMEIISNEITDIMIEQTIESAKNQKEGTGIQEEEDFTDIVSDIIININTETASKMIEEINEIDTDTNLSLEVISGISVKDSEKLDALSEFNKEQIEEITKEAVQKAENTSEDSQLIANVVSVVNDELVNTMIEEVSKNSLDEKQTLSAKVLKAIVDTEPNKIEVINNEITDIMIEQTIESAKNQEEGIGIQEEADFTDIVSDIIININTETASKMIEEINEIDTETNLSLEIISGISVKDSEKLDALSEFNKEQIEEITKEAVQKAENTSEDSQLIANVVSVVNDELVNTMIEEVSKNSLDEKQTLSAKVLKAIVDTEPNKIEVINNEVKDIMIEQTVESAKNQEEGIGIQENENLTDIVSDIIVNIDTETAAKIIEEVNDTETLSNLSLKVISGISEKDSNTLQTLISNDKNQMDVLTENAIQKAENTTEDSELIAKVVSVANEELVNKVVDEVSKISTDEKQTLSAKVLKAIVDVEPSKIETISGEIKDTIIKQTIESAKDQKEGNLQDEEDLSDFVAEIIVKTDTETASKVIEEINDTETDTNLSLDVMSGVSNKDENKINDLSEEIKDEIEELAEDAVQKAENTNEDSQKIADVVSVANNDLVNKVFEDVGQTSVDEKQTLSAKVLKAIVDTDSTKVEILNDDIKDIIIEQTIESAKNQEEGTGIQEENNLTDIVSDIIVNTDSETAEKIINEVNEIETETNLSLKVISGISEKDTEKLNELAENNLEQIEQLTTDAVQNAENTSQDSELIASVITSVNDELLNKVVETVNQVAQEESDKETLSAKVLQSIVDNQPDKINVISEDNKNQLIENVVEVAKKQKEGDVEDTTDFTEVITNIVANSEIDTASKVLEEVDKIETDSDFKLDFIEELNEEENFSEKADILSATSVKNDEFLTNIINEAVQRADDEEGIEKLTGIINDSEGTIIDKIIESGNLNLENKEKINEALTNIADNNPNKLIDIIENSEGANETVEELKNKVENNEAITLDDFEEVFDRNVTPN